MLTACSPTVALSSTPTPWPEPHVAVLVDGLLNPIGMAALPDGDLLVAEEGTGQNDDSAGVSLITPDGQVGRLISGLPSGMDSGDLAGVPMVALSPAGDKLYFGNFGAGHLWTLPLTPDQQTQGVALPDTPYTADQLVPEMKPLNNVRLTNPFDITFDSDGDPVVTDASGNGVATLNPDGTTRFIHRFAPLPDPTSDSKFVTIEAVPTGIIRIKDEYYVTLTGGCPYPPQAGQLVAIDENRNQRTIVDGLNMPIDVAQGPDDTIWVLEFAKFTPDASCFTGSGYKARTGRLSRLAPDGMLQPVLDNLNFPGAVLPMPDGSLYISEVFPGRILHVTFDEKEALSPIVQGSRGAEEQGSRDYTQQPSRAIQPDQYDQVLRQVIQENDLQPNPGVKHREGDTPLARLGQELFFDPILSGDQNISCATCHHPHFAMGDGRVLPIGAGGHGLGPQRVFEDQVTLGPEASAVRRLAGVTDPQTGVTTAHNPFFGTFIARNSLTVINSALFPKQFWDSRVESYALGDAVKTKEDVVNDMQMTDALAAQALFPVTSLHEMAASTFGGLPPETIRTALVERLRAIPEYTAQFEAIFGPSQDDAGAVTMRRAVEALAAFERRFIFTDAPWDDYLAGQPDALTEQQKRGALLFFGQIKPDVNCAQCHSGDLFTDFEHHNLLVPQLGPGKGNGYTKREDWGRAGVTFDLRDRYEFRTPSLRNADLTAPYFHDGAFATLPDAIRHHADIWDSAQNYDPSANDISPALYSSLRSFQPEKQWQTAARQLRDGLPLTDDDVADLVAFIKSLTDPEARDLDKFTPSSVPSGLPLDPLPEETAPPQAIASTAPMAPAINPQSDSASDTDSALSGELRLHDVAAEVGLDFRHGAFQTDIFQDPAAAMGAGLCWIDYNNDGWLDLYLVNSHAEDEVGFWESQGGLPRNALYRNAGGKFTDVSTEAKTDLAMRGNGCVAADFNNDGWWDLYVTADGPNALLWNNGDGTFTDGAAAAGVAAPEWNSAAVVGDLNNDGWPDLFVSAYIDLDNQIPKPSGAFPQDYYGLPDRLYVSNGLDSSTGHVTFREVTQIAGLLREERGLGALLTDLDRDGDLDLYIANDGQPNRLYANEPMPNDPEGLGFRFVDLTDSAHVGDSGSGMGVAGGDYDGDGRIDLFITNWERELNALYHNETTTQDRPTFQYSTFRIGIMGLGNGLTGWGTALVDLDQDTDQDLLFVDGRVPVTNMETDPEPVQLYRNRGRDLEATYGRPRQFVEWTTQTGLEDVGPLMARGAAVADYDNDGDLDIAINTIAGHAILLQNDGQHGNWLQVAINGFAPGTFATAELPDGTRLVRELYAGSSYLASEDPRLHFGLGDADHVTRLLIDLPNGKHRAFENVPANQLFTVSPP